MAFHLPLRIELTGTPLRYINSLDAPTRERIKAKLLAIAADPLNARLSLPLTNVNQRRTRVGNLRVLFELSDTTLTVADAGPRGQIYRKLSRKASK